jgi:hypothetical protein
MQKGFTGGNQLLSFCIEVSAAGFCGCRRCRCMQAAGCRLCRWRHVPAHLAGSAGGGMAHLGQTAVWGRRWPATCRRWVWRHPPAGTGPGGTCHVSPAQGCRHSEGVFFGKNFQRWSFLTLRWRSWSYMSKIPTTTSSTRRSFRALMLDCWRSSSANATWACTVGRGCRCERHQIELVLPYPVPLASPPQAAPGATELRPARVLLLKTSPAAAAAGLLRGGGGAPAAKGGRGVPGSRGGGPSRGGVGGRVWVRRVGGLGST